jgi:hypothetical protein
MKTLILAATLAILGLGAVTANAGQTTCRWFGDNWVCTTY